MKSKRQQKRLRESVKRYVPKAPLSDILEIEAIASAGHLRHLPLSIAIWQAITSHARHARTDYDILLQEGYDRESARHFVLEELNTVLEDWGCTRRVEMNE